MMDIYNINKNIRPLTKFKKVNDKITCECIICNNIWDTTPHSLLSGKGCPKCGYEHAKMLTRKSHDKFINELYDKNKDIEIIQDNRIKEINMGDWEQKKFRPRECEIPI